MVTSNLMLSLSELGGSGQDLGALGYLEHYVGERGCLLLISYYGVGWIFEIPRQRHHVTCQFFSFRELGSFLKFDS